MGGKGKGPPPKPVNHCATCNYEERGCYVPGNPSNCRNDGKFATDYEWGRQFCAELGGVYCVMSDSPRQRVAENSALLQASTEQNIGYTAVPMGKRDPHHLSGPQDDGKGKGPPPKPVNHCATCN